VDHPDVDVGALHRRAEDVERGRGDRHRRRNLLPKKKL
jgi:hypothetical protein